MQILFDIVQIPLASRIPLDIRIFLGTRILSALWTALDTLILSALWIALPLSIPLVLRIPLDIRIPLALRTVLALSIPLALWIALSSSIPLKFSLINSQVDVKHWLIAVVRKRIVTDGGAYCYDVIAIRIGRTRNKQTKNSFNLARVVFAVSWGQRGG